MSLDKTAELDLDLLQSGESSEKHEELREDSDLEDCFNYELDHDFSYNLNNTGSKFNLLEFNSELDELLFNLIENNETDSFIDIFNSNKKFVNMNCFNEKKETFLIQASRKENFTLVEFLLKQNNIFINKQDYKGDTALHIAIRNNNRFISSILLDDWKLDINIKNENNETYLHLGCIRGDLFYIDKILKFKDIDINKRDCFGYTSLDYLFLYKKYDLIIIKKIINHPNFKLNEYIFEDKELIFLCPQLLSLNLNDIANTFITKKDTLLTFCCKNGNMDLYHKLTKIKDIDINLPNKDNQTPLELSLKFNNIEIAFNLLSKREIKVNKQVIYNILRYCLSDDYIIKLFNIILMYHITYTNLAVLEIILCDILEASIHNNNYNVFRYFFEQSARNVNSNLVKKKETVTNLLILSISFSKKILYYLLELPNIFIDVSLLDIVVCNGDYETTSLISKKITNFNFRNRNNYTALMTAILNKNIDIILLLKDKCNITKADIKELLRQNLEFEYLFNVLFNILEIIWCDIFGETLEEMPDTFFFKLLQKIETENPQTIIKSILSSSENIHKMIENVKNMDLELCHNSDDIILLDRFIDIEKTSVIQYGDKIEEKYRTMSLESILSIVKNSGYGYLKDILDPFDRSKLCNKKCPTTGLYMFQECIFRKAIKNIL